MKYQDQMDHLSYSAELQYHHPPADWREAMEVTPGHGSLHDQVRYHFKMCFDLAMHLTIADPKSPLFTMLDNMFNFSLIELRFAELKYLNYLLELRLVGFLMEKQGELFLLAQALYRARCHVSAQATVLKGDQPFKHHTSKQLIRYIVKTMRFLTAIDFDVLRDKVDATFWEQLCVQLGFVIHMVNRVLVLSPRVDDIDQ